MPSETAILVASAATVGVGTAFAAIVFVRLISFVWWLTFDYLPTWLDAGPWWLVIAPGLGGLIVGPIIVRFAREAKGHGVPEVMQAIALNGGRMRGRLVFAKVAASALTIGTGGSAGREGPIVQVGAAIGSALGRRLRLSEARMRNLVACGSAAGIAATFNAPIAGVLFAMEVILGELNPADLGSVVVAGVSASVVSRAILGSRPAFSIPSHEMVAPHEALLFIPLGALAAVVGVVFIRLLYGTEDYFDRLRMPEALQPAVGGLALGGLALALPLFARVSGQPTLSGGPSGDFWWSGLGVLGSGLPVVEQALRAELPLVSMAALFLLKPIATSLTLGSGGSGGVFAPSLFTGAMLGGAYGSVMERWMPLAETAGSGAYAVVGMATLFAATARAPLTALMIVFEMTNDYQLLLPLLVAVFSATLIAERLHRESIYTLKLARRGIRLRHGRRIDVLESVRVVDAMGPAITVPVDLPLPLLAAEFDRTERAGFAVVDSAGRLVGFVSLSDYRSADTANLEALTVGDIATREVLTAFTDESVADAMHKMAPRDLSRLPVVSRDHPQTVVGMLRRHEIVRAYDLMTTLDARGWRQGSEGEPTDAHFVDCLVTSSSPLLGRRIDQAILPREAVLVAVRRGSRLIIPHGDTVLERGDRVTALVERHAADALRAAFGPAKLT